MCMIVMLIVALVIIPASVEALNTTGSTMLHAVVIGMPSRMNCGIDRCRDKLHFTRLHDFNSLVDNSLCAGKQSIHEWLHWPW